MKNVKGVFKTREIEIREMDEHVDHEHGNIQGEANIFVIEAGKSGNVHNNILKQLQKICHMNRVNEVKDCNLILVFCPIVSRAGTDIVAALQELNIHSETKPAIFLVLHHTFDPDKIVPDSSRFVKRGNTLTVDCLFHEDTGLLECKKNQEALAQIADWFKNQGYAAKGQVNYFQPAIYMFMSVRSYAARVMSKMPSCRWTRPVAFVCLLGLVVWYSLPRRKSIKDFGL